MAEDISATARARNAGPWHRAVDVWKFLQGKAPHQLLGLSPSEKRFGLSTRVQSIVTALGIVVDVSIDAEAGASVADKAGF